MSRSVRSALCVAALIVTGLVTASSASATGCPSGRFCVWKDNGFVTAGSTFNYFGYLNWSVQYSAHNYLNTSDEVHDDTSSWHNHGNTNSARVFKDTYYNGTFSTAKPPGDSQGDMTNGWNDTLDSGCFLSGSSCIGP